MANEVSLNAYRRLLLLHDQDIARAKTIAKRDGYADFFIETPAGSFQEAFADPDSNSRLEGFEKERTVRRMASLDRIRLQAPQDVHNVGSYSDFFTDGPPDQDPPPFHETWKEADEGKPTTQELLRDPAARARALSQLRVVQAYLRMRERLLSK